MRTLVTFLLAAFVSAVAYAGPPIDLDAPDALKSLQARNPDHYRKIFAILAEVRERASPGVVPWIEATFDASEVECIAWRVSDPPKLRVSFTLDATRYTAVVVARSPPLAALR